MTTFPNDVEAVQELQKKYQKTLTEISKVIIGQQEIVSQVLCAILCEGHCLLVGVPGLAKTLLVKTIADVVNLDFNRIQFTPDLMPSDITGTEVIDEQRKFKFIKGPIFANIILADEINRTPPKTQSALLEAMQERTVTVSGVSHKLSKPFFVIATQNPIEQEGTYPLPEAQLDRFMFQLNLTYPKFDDEIKIVKSTTSHNSITLSKTISSQDLINFQQLIRKIPVTDNVLQYAVQMTQKSRPNSPLSTDFVNNYVAWGAGPRASQYLILGAKCHAAIHGKFAPDIEDVRAIVSPILRHRILKNYKAEAEGITIDQIIQKLC